MQDVCFKGSMKLKITLLTSLFFINVYASDTLDTILSKKNQAPGSSLYKTLKEKYPHTIICALSFITATLSFYIANQTEEQIKSSIESIPNYAILMREITSGVARLNAISFDVSYSLDKKKFYTTFSPPETLSKIQSLRFRNQATLGIGLGALWLTQYHLQKSWQEIFKQETISQCP